MWVLRDFFSADGVVRNRSISTIKNRQLLPKSRQSLELNLSAKSLFQQVLIIFPEASGFP